MYNIGDRIVYPMHGAGVIEEIEEKKILEDVRKYYVIRIPFGDMKVMIPVDNSEGIGVREIISLEEMEDVLGILGAAVEMQTENWNRRYRENMEKLRSGSVYSVAEVVRNLMFAEKEKGLSTGERKMLLNAKQILISEMILIRDISLEEALKIVEGAVFSK